jgi:hypothetical protein
MQEIVSSVCILSHTGKSGHVLVSAHCRAAARRNQHASSARWHAGSPASLDGITVAWLGPSPFCQAGPATCAAFSRAEVNGEKVELSGSDLFNRVVMPLANASDHAMRTFGHPGGNEIVYPQLIFCIAVLDAPMLLVESPEQWSDPILNPWVRVIRQEPNIDQFTEGPIRHYGVDLVHVDFFDTFIRLTSCLSQRSSDAAPFS